MEVDERLRVVNCSLFTINNVYYQHQGEDSQLGDQRNSKSVRSVLTEKSEKSLSVYRGQQSTANRRTIKKQDQGDSIIPCMTASTSQPTQMHQNKPNKVFRYYRPTTNKKYEHKESPFRKKVSISRSSSKNEDQLGLSISSKENEKEKERKRMRKSDPNKMHESRDSLQGHKTKNVSFEGNCSCQNKISLQQKQNLTYNSYLNGRLSTELKKLDGGLDQSYEITSNKKLRKRGKNFSREISWNFSNNLPPQFTQPSLHNNFSNKMTSITAQIPNNSKQETLQNKTTDKLISSKKMTKISVKQFLNGPTNDFKSKGQFDEQDIVQHQIQEAKLVESKFFDTTVKNQELYERDSKHRKNISESLHEFSYISHEMSEPIAEHPPRNSKLKTSLLIKKSSNKQKLLKNQLSSKRSSQFLSPGVAYNYEAISFPYETPKTLNDLPSRYVGSHGDSSTSSNHISIVNDDFDSYSNLLLSNKQTMMMSQIHNPARQQMQQCLFNQSEGFRKFGQRRICSLIPSNNSNGQ